MAGYARQGGIGETDRSQSEQIRRLRTRRRGDQVDGWHLLQPYITPGWASPVNTSVSDLTDDWCPRYYVDRQRVYLGGVVQLSLADIAPFGADTILDLDPPGAGSITPARYTDIGQLTEDMYWTNTGWLPHSAQVWPSIPSLVIITGGVDDPIEDGVAISLEGLSWRLDG